MTSPTPAAASSSSGATWWIWVLLALAVVGLIVALIIRSRRGSNPWKDRATLAISNGESLYRRLADELSLAGVGDAVPSGLEESRRLTDVLDGNLAELSQGTLDVGVTSALMDLRAKTGGLRDALGAIGPGPVVAHGALGHATEQLTAFERSLEAFRDQVSPPTPGTGTAEWR